MTTNRLQTAMLATLAAALGAIGVTACDSSQRPQPTSSANNAPGAANSGTRGPDRDNDSDHNSDDGRIVGFGHEAYSAERRQAMALVSDYYAAAAAGNGAGGCSLLTPFVAESVAEDLGHTPGLRGRACATVLTKVFRRHHAALVGKRNSMHIAWIRVEGDRGLAIIDFRAIPEFRQITLRRSAGRWTLREISDGLIE